MKKHKRETIPVVATKQLRWKLQSAVDVAASTAALTYWRHSTDAESWSRGREAELVQYCVGPCWINHCNVAVAGGAGHHPHTTLTEGETAFVYLT